MVVDICQYSFRGLIAGSLLSLVFRNKAKVRHMGIGIGAGYAYNINDGANNMFIGSWAQK
mgnify:CR=1 FL=1